MINWVEINKENLYHNIAQFKKITPDSQIWPVVKSNAYGHGLKEIVSLLDKDKFTTGFMVVNLSEALEVKNISDKPVMVLSYFDRVEADLVKASKYKISLPIYDFETIDYLDSFAKEFLVNLKIDTGTSRLGFLENDANKAIDYIKNKKNLKLNSIYTHFAESESEDLAFSNEQWNTLSSISQSAPGLKIHAACSAASISMPHSQADIIRLGLSTYGLWPSKATYQRGKKLGLELKPVMSVKTKIIQIKDLQAGDTIGYNRTYRCDKDCQIAVVPFGYNEGYSRSLSNQGQMLVNGHKCLIRGNICMNLSMVDISGLEAKIGDIVTVLGVDGQQSISAEDIAKHSQTINYEVVTKINNKLPRIIV
ncbi:alanine racemase [Patescibacteria group bacterium]|nr:alanine racemase [Patescibacteria group bacterium]